MRITGGKKLEGEIFLQGAKNSAIPIKAATQLIDGECSFKNMPNLELHPGALRTGINFAKTGKINVFPGDRCGYCKNRCAIGCRPLNWHLWALKKYAKGESIELPYPSVGATQNLLLASATGPNTLFLHNYSKEPETMDLITFLKKAGAKIHKTEKCLVVLPVSKLKPVKNYELIQDRIEAVTWQMINYTTDSRIDFKTTEVTRRELNRIYFTELPAEICTSPYPGFPTDYQPLVTPWLALQEGEHHIKENVFDNRFYQAIELKKLGAKVSVQGSMLTIKGIKKFIPSTVALNATDVRCAASLLISALATKGETTINNSFYLHRGYDNILNKLKIVGAEVLS